MTATAEMSRPKVSRWKMAAIRLPKNMTPMPTITKLRRKLKSALENTATDVSSRKSAAVMPKAARTMPGPEVRATMSMTMPAKIPQMNVNRV